MIYFVRRHLSLVHAGLGAAIIFVQISTCNAESLPETVERHEQLIKSLQDQIRTLRSSLDGSPKAQPSTSDNNTPKACIKDFRRITSTSLSKPQLDSVIDLNGSGIILKHIRSVQTPANQPNYVLFASNIDELNNKRLDTGSSYVFSFEGCRYSLTIESIDTGANIIKLFLNYQ